MAELIVVNGPPGVGKSAVARRYVDAHPLTLLLEMDGLRTSLGGWAEHRESMALARGLALALAEAHLRSGHDVVMPQFLGRTDLLEALDGLVARVGARLVEVVLVGDREAVVDRFRARRARLLASGEPHPEADVVDTEIEQFVAEALTQVGDVCRARPRTVTVVADTLDGAAHALELAVRRTPSAG